MNKTLKLFFSFLIFISFSMFACNKGGYATNQAALYTRAEMMYPARAPAIIEEMQAMDMASGGGYGNDSLSAEYTPDARKLVRRADLSIRVENPDAMEDTLSALMEKYDAWPASTGIYENSRNYSIRVPSPSYDTMLSELSELGRVLSRTENAEDVTLRYYDLDGRLATRQELLKTYQSYLGKALNIEELMTVENRIADLQREIDWTGTELRNLSSLIDYSTIDVQIVGPAGASYSKATFGERLQGLFGSYGDVASSAMLVLAGLVIYGIPAILILLLLFSLLFGRIGLLKKLFSYAMKKKEV